MFNRHLVRATALATMAFLAGTAQANLLLNGSFEDDSIPGPFAYKANGSLTGWGSTNAGNGTVLFTGAYKPVADGLQAVQLEYPNDTLFQTFATTSGQTYEVKFSLSAYDTTPAALQVDVAGSSQSYSGSSAGYTTYSFQFVANSASSTLTFTNTHLPPPAYAYPHLDNVSVNAVPEPEGYALAMLALGGLGLVARRRKSA